MKVVLNTNVLLSGLLKPYGKPAAILRLVLSGALQVAYDGRILSEYRTVLLREKFHFSREMVDALLEQIEAEGFFVVARPLKKHLPDPDDEPFLEVALSGKVDALITGNKRHYPASASKGIAVLTPTEFLARTRQF